MLKGVLQAKTKGQLKAIKKKIYNTGKHDYIGKYKSQYYCTFGMVCNFSLLPK